MTGERDNKAFYGADTLQLIESLCAEGIGQMTVLMRHSVREFNRQVHDLVNPLTDEGRHHCRLLGAALPKTLHLRGYASPPERCVETASLVMQTHADQGGSKSNVRPVESLGVFYALDQIKMWKGLQSSDGLSGFITRWAAGDVAVDAMIPADQAAQLIARSTFARMQSGEGVNQVDLCVTHDMTILLLRDRLLHRPAQGHSVDFMEGLALYEAAGRVWLRSLDAPAVDITDSVS